MRYKHLFFDLDRTLWDFDKSALETLQELFVHFKVDRYCADFDQFHKDYIRINEGLWEKYRIGEIQKDELRSQRFLDTMSLYQWEDDTIAELMGLFYLDRSPIKPNTFPGTHDMLDALAPNYELHIITNGFEEVQHIKMKHSALDHYFEAIVTSEKAGVKKPHPQIFEHALDLANAKAEDSLMIGDDFEVDVLGAHQIGIDAVYFNPNEHAKSHDFFEYKEPSELVDWLSQR